MALADIISKIESDASSEAAAIEAAAQQRSDEIRTAADSKAAEYREGVIGAAQESAEREASRIVVAAKLAARDKGLAARRALIDEALALTAAGLAELPAERYAALLASRIARVARGGEELRFGSSDASIASVVVEQVSRIAPGLSVTVSSEPAPFERGALVQGDRVKADLSLSSIVEERRDELELVLAEAMFGKGE